MSKVVFSAMMFALLCTGNLSTDALSNNHLKDFNSATIAHYQMLSQYQNADVHDNFDDDEEEEEAFL